MKDAVALTVLAAVPAVVGGLLFDAIRGHTTVTRAVATGFWIASAVYLVLVLFSRSKVLSRLAARPLPEGWVFGAAAFALAVIGAAIDAA